MPCHGHRTWHPSPSLYTHTGPTCRCAIHWCGTSHWKTQLPLLMSWVRPDWEILPRPSTHTSECSTLWCYGGNIVSSVIFFSYQPVLLSQPPPVRYFPASSPVVDLVYGNLLDAADLLYQDEILFVMYYAPWCAKSSRVRWEFDKAARYLENEVTYLVDKTLEGCFTKSSLFTFKFNSLWGYDLGFI